MAATPLASVPSYDLPIMPTAPVVQSPVTGVPSTVCAVLRPLSQSITATTEATSSLPPTSPQPVERVVPTMSTPTTAYPRGTK